MRPKRFHIAIGVKSIDQSRAYYSRLFAAEPTKVADDQVDWILDDPAVNFSIFYNPARQIGPEHIGFDVPVEHVEEWSRRIDVPDGEYWSADPDNIRVEVFSTDPDS